VRSGKSREARTTASPRGPSACLVVASGRPADRMGSSLVRRPGRRARPAGRITPGAPMSTATRFLRRDPAAGRPWAETCGQIRCLIEEKDGAAGEVHHVEIRDARLHYHEHTDEFYYVIAGRGTMTLDGEEVELHPGVVVYVPRGVRHKAKGDLTVLVVCVPRGVLDDVHEVEQRLRPSGPGEVGQGPGEERGLRTPSSPGANGPIS